MMFEQSNPAFLRAAEAIFFQAMRDGYANPNTEKIPIVGLPGSKSITWERGPWKVVDLYFVHQPFLESTGMTVISYEEKPVWVMHYGGYYHPAAIPFLKKCLAEAYTSNVFLGGRGPGHMKEGDYSYLNNVRRSSTFAKFAGDELILKTDTSTALGGQSVLGKHWYHGLAMTTTHR